MACVMDANITKLMTKIIAATGHRPEKLGGYSKEVSDKLLRLATAAIAKLQTETVISGMALGWDTAIAHAAVNLKIPLIAAVPFAGQDAKWKDEDREKWEWLLFQSSKIIFVDTLKEYQVEGVEPRRYHPAKMHKRNEWMIDNSNHVLALFDPTTEKGGTFECMKYAESLDREILNAWNSWVKYG